MPVPSVPVLYPDYYKKFSCIGGDCPDNCCYGWFISIDKNTYNLYRNIKDPEFKATLSQRVKRVKGEKANEQTYAMLQLNENGKCSYLTEAGLCGIHAAHGPKYLSRTCEVYPRINNMLQKDLRELSLVTSCPVVVRTACFKEEPIAFFSEQMPLEATNRLLRHPSGFNLKEGKSAYLEDHAFIVREFCMKILQCRTASLCDRMLTMGMMLQRLVSLVPELPQDASEQEIRAAAEAAKKAAENVPKLCATYLVMLQSGQLGDVLAGAESDPETTAKMEIGLFAAAVQMTMTMKHNTKSYRLMAKSISEFPVIQKLIPGLVAGKMDISEEDMDVFRQMHIKFADLTQKHWKPFLEERGHILENYLVNMIFTTCAPFKYHKELDVYQHFVILAAHYALLRLIFCACAEHMEDDTDEAVITAMSGMSMNTQHGDGAKKLASVYAANGWDRLAYMTFLLKE